MKCTLREQLSTGGFDVVPGDQGAPQRQEGLVHVVEAFVAEIETPEAMEPGERAFDDPAKGAEATAVRTAGLGHDGDDALRQEARVTRPGPVGAIPLHDAGLPSRTAWTAGDRRCGRDSIGSNWRTSLTFAAVS
jgi:hypothetical protein